MRYVEARYNLYNRDLAYRFYVTDGLKAIGGLNIRFVDLFKPAETRTSDEIIGGIKDKLQKLGGE
jgi:hypothetical protein